MAERQTLERALRKQAPSAPADAPEILGKGLKWQAKPGRLVLSGPMVTEELQQALRAFLVSHAKQTS